MRRRLRPAPRRSSSYVPPPESVHRRPPVSRLLLLPLPVPLRLSRHARLGHGPQVEHAVELRVGEQALVAHQLPHRDVSRHRFLGELRRGGVADPRRQRGDDGRAPLQPVLAHRAIRLDPFHASPSDCISGTRSCPSRSSRPVSSFRCFTISRGYSGSTFSPVPTALPPIPRSRSAAAAAAIRSRLRSTVPP